MKKTLFLLIVFMSVTFAFSQSKSFWQKEMPVNNTKIKPTKENLPKTQTYSLNIQAMSAVLENAPMRGKFFGNSNLIIAFPNSEGILEHFRVMEAPVMHPDLMAKYPNIKSYAGQGVEDPTARIRFSISPLGLQSMTLSATRPASFIEPYTYDGKGYTVYKRADKKATFNDFECSITETVSKSISGDNFNLRNADDATLRTYRLAMSATGEYTAYHGGTKALALAAINATMTRVNGIFETDFNVTMVLIANTDAVIYTDSGSDPYTNSLNSQLQSTLSNVIGEANYDIGHLVHNGSNNGNAGCIGCVCVNNQKGSGYTSHTVPEGDFFDVDYVAHEMGHQFGGRHTFTHTSEGAGIAQVEPGSGSTIMSYAGITGATDVQSNVDPYFHAISIQQITDYVKSTSCQTNTNTGNAVPTANAGLNYTIPKGTPFVLTGTGSDANTGDALTYCWEQMDENNASTTYPSVTATTGVAFRTYNPTIDNKRYFPRLSTIKTGATSWQWEAVPNVARALNFRFTVRDNVAGGANNNSDDMIVTVNGTAGPFLVSSPNTNITWNAGTTQTVTWDVAGTTGNGINTSNVDIFLSIDGGDTYTIALASGVPNDGSQDIVVPNNQGTQNRIMVKGSNNIFLDISNTDFTIAGQVVCNATVPTGLAASSIGPNSATLSWDAVPGASFDLQYRQVGAATWTTVSVNGISSVLSGLSSLTQYEAQVRSKCPNNSTSAYSSSINFTTTDVQLNYCTSASTNINDEFIGRVQLNTIDNASGGQFYTDFTNISTTLTKGSQYTITVTPTWTGTVYNEGYSVWIDYNRDGDFTDAGEQVWTQARTKSTPVSGSFTIPSNAVQSTTRMRVSMKYNAVPTSCETFTYGEVEDYTVIIQSSSPDTTAPIITLVGLSPINLNVGDTYTEQGATAFDNIDGDITANIVIGGDVVNTNVAGTYVVTYNVSDSAGNTATQVTRTVNVVADTVAPIITLVGASTITLNIGDTYTEQGATASDNIDGDITASIVIAGDVVNTNVAGTYVVTYNVSDVAGNAAAQVIRTITINPDTTIPVITLLGASTVNVNIGSIYTEQGATATDNIDGDITASIVITGSVNTSIAGAYLVNYNVSDAAGNAATQVTRTVNVVADTTAPVITLIGPSSITLSLGSIYTEQGATATDNIDGDITASIVITGSVNTSIAGTYLVNYNVSDAAGNAATQVTRTVTIDPDTTVPVIILVGASIINLNVGNTYTEQGATATDNIDGDITANIVIGGDVVNTNIAGIYVITYNVSDAAGNTATQVIRTVNVVADTTAPIITLVGAPTINLNVGDTYTEQGAIATDNIDGDITASIVIGGSTVNTNVAGTYVVTYNVSDAAGNTATQVTRTVTVTQPSTGCSGGISTFPYSEGFENTLGAWTQSSADDINWTIDANGTPSSGTGPSSASQGSYYIYVEASGNGTGYPNKRAIINSPCFDLSALSQATFSFKYHMYGSTNMGAIDLEISNDNGATWTSIWSQSGNKGNSWLTANIDLAAYIGGSVQLRFNRVTGSTWQADIAIDDVSLTNGGSTTSCNTGDVTLSITLDNYPEETGWTLKNASGATIDSANYSTANPDGSTVTKTFTGLAAGDYTFTITDSYGDGICCSYGNGSYTLTGSLGTIVSGGSFGSSEATVFCIESLAKKGVDSRIENDAFTEIKLYPNPVKGNFLNIRTSFSNISYEVYNMLGQMVAKGKVVNKQIDVSELESAVYQIKFNADSRRITKRFIKE
jgi:Metallo-peptidase family M12B Reprolysin-like/GEVED domain/Bacterial surface protein, Ig-like domain/MAM domain, meprin/A5/mu/Secretion system C-terminal sorting domain